MPDTSSKVGRNISHYNVLEKLMGAVAYMSSEQALGRELDLRSDLFSFGAVLYERWPPVHRPSSAPRIRRYLRRDPSRSAETAIQLNSQLPAQLDQSILKALEKIPIFVIRRPRS